MFLNFFPGLFRIALDQVLDEQRDVVHPFAQRGDLDWKDIQPVEEILAKCACRHGCLQVAVRGGQHAHVHGNRLAAADPFNFPLLEHSQQRDLSLGRQVADLVKEDRPAVGQLKSPETPLQRAGEGAFLVSEQLGGDERREESPRN